MTQNLSLLNQCSAIFCATKHFGLPYYDDVDVSERTLPHLFVVPNKSTKNWDIDNANRPFESANHIQNDVILDVC